MVANQPPVASDIHQPPQLPPGFDLHRLVQVLLHEHAFVAAEAPNDVGKLVDRVLIQYKLDVAAIALPRKRLLPGIEQRGLYAALGLNTICSHTNP